MRKLLGKLWTIATVAFCLMLLAVVNIASGIFSKGPDGVADGLNRIGTMTNAMGIVVGALLVFTFLEALRPRASLQPIAAWIQAILMWLPQSIRDDAEGMIREFAHVRDRDHARGIPRWLTALKCGCCLTVYVLRSGVAAACAALKGKLLRP